MKLTKICAYPTCKNEIEKNPSLNARCHYCDDCLTMMDLMTETLIKLQKEGQEERKIKKKEEERITELNRESNLEWDKQEAIEKAVREAERLKEMEPTVDANGWISPGKPSYDYWETLGIGN